MCKVMAMAGLTDATRPKAWKFLEATLGAMSKYDRDGIGYAAQSGAGVWGERWLKPEDAFKVRLTDSDRKVAHEFRLAIQEPPYTEFGLPAPDTSHAIIYHSRMATCGKGMANTHPFVRDNTALIHNGVIRNAHQFENITSTCDSEVILNEYISKGVPNDVSAVGKALSEFEGYFACAVLTQDTDGNQYMDVFKNPTAQLVAAFIPELETVVFCTNQDILEEGCRAMGWKMGYAFKFQEDQLVRLNAKTGELISVTKFKSGPFAGGGWGSHGWKTGALATGNRSMDRAMAQYDSRSPYAYAGEG